jgi:hypothetical protein
MTNISSVESHINDQRDKMTCRMLVTALDSNLVTSLAIICTGLPLAQARYLMDRHEEPIKGKVPTGEP